MKRPFLDGREAAEDQKSGQAAKASGHYDLFT
jgi:hypothetical protein